MHSNGRTASLFLVSRWRRASGLNFSVCFYRFFFYFPFFNPILNFELCRDLSLLHSISSGCGKMINLGQLGRSWILDTSVALAFAHQDDKILPAKGEKCRSMRHFSLVDNESQRTSDFRLAGNSLFFLFSSLGLFMFICVLFLIFFFFFFFSFSRSKGARINLCARTGERKMKPFLFFIFDKNFIFSKGKSRRRIKNH